MKIIYEHREYHLAMIHFLDDLARNGPGGSDMPGDQKEIYSLCQEIKKPSNKLCGVELHTNLIKRVLYKDVVNQTGFAIWTKLVHTQQPDMNVFVSKIQQD